LADRTVVGMDSRRLGRQLQMRPVCRLAGLLGFLLLTFQVIAPVIAAEPTTGQRAILQLVINEVDQGEVYAWLRSGDVLLRLQDLESAGVHNLEGTRESIGKHTYVALSSLAPAVTYLFDDKTLVLHVTVQSTLQGTTVLDLTPAAPSGTVYTRDTSLFVNYAAETRGFSRYSAFGEAGLSINGHLLSSTVSRNEDGRVVRGLSALTLNDTQNLTRWTIGDSFATSDLLGGSVFFAGISVSRNFGLNPYFYSFPRPGLSGTALTPSTVSVYSDNGLLRQESVAPGQFELQNIPVSNGYRVNRVVIRDIFGREAEILSPFYLSTRVLQAGISEYSYNVGVRRNNLGVESWHYDSPVLLARYRFGATDSLTPGGHVEAADHVVNGGLRLTTRFILGEMDLSVAGSHADDVSGSAASFTYSFLRRWFSLGASVQVASAHYATVSLPASVDRAEVQATGFFGFPIGTRTSINVEETYSRFRDTGEVRRTGVTGNVRVTENLSLFSSNSWSQVSAGSSSFEVFVGLSYFFGNNTTGNIYTQQQKGSSVEGIRVQRSLPVGPGLGYLVEGSTGADTSHGLGQIQYQGQYGRYEALYDSAVARPVLTVSGGVVALGGSVHATRAIDDGFALIRTPGVSGMRGYVNNQEVGRTNAKGELVVPNNLVSYYGNRIGINDQDIPLDYRVDTTERTIAPPFRGGALVVFPVKRLQILTGTLRIETAGELRVPTYGTLTVTTQDGTIESPVGKNGEFYLENLDAGSHEAVVEYQTTTCRFRLNVPATPEPFVKLGEIRCGMASEGNR